MSVSGVERVKGNVDNILIRASADKSEAALYAILSQGAAIAQTMTPIDTSNLANSQYAPQIDMRAGKVTGQVGYTARYAKAVHEAPGTLKGLPREHFGKTGNQSAFGPQQVVSFGGGSGTGSYWDPDAEPQFLTKGFEQLKPSIPVILKEVYRV